MHTLLVIHIAFGLLTLLIATTGLLRSFFKLTTTSRVQLAKGLSVATGASLVSGTILFLTSANMTPVAFCKGSSVYILVSFVALRFTLSRIKITPGAQSIIFSSFTSGILAVIVATLVKTV